MRAANPMQTRPLSLEDISALTALLKQSASHNPFHLSSLREYGLADPASPEGKPWAIGAFHEGNLRGVVMALRGTGGLYCTPGDSAALDAVAAIVSERALSGNLTLLSGHASQVDPVLPIITEGGTGTGRPDRCWFRTLLPGEMKEPSTVDGFSMPRQATEDDLERLIDFYQVGFYSLANLPSRQAWRTRLSEQLEFRSLFIVENMSGQVASAALSSAEGGGAAMLGGVATLTRYRGQGLSALCVGALCRSLFSKGFGTISLFYLKDNAAAARVYTRLGFSDAGEWILLPLGFGASFAPLLGLRARPQS